MSFYLKMQPIWPECPVQGRCRHPSRVLGTAQPGESAELGNDSLWKYSKILVHFLDEAVQKKPDGEICFVNKSVLLNDWGLSESKIIQWANRWNCDDSVPEFEVWSEEKSADIHVKLDGKIIITK